MNLKEFKEQVDFLYDSCKMNRQDPTETTVGIMVQTLGSVGATPTVGMKGISMGFDWDYGRVLVQPEKMLREIERDELAALRRNHDELGWSLYKIDKIKRENEELKRKLEQK